MLRFISRAVIHSNEAGAAVQKEEKVRQQLVLPAEEILMLSAQLRVTAPTEVLASTVCRSLISQFCECPVNSEKHLTSNRFGQE